MKLFSESKDEDIQRIADLTIKRLKEKYPPSFENVHAKTASEALLSGEGIKSDTKSSIYNNYICIEDKVERKCNYSRHLCLQGRDV